MFTLRLALKYLSERKLRSFLTTLAIVFGVMVLSGLNAILPAIEDTFRQSLMTAANQVDLTLTSETRSVFDIDVLERVAATDGVARVTGSLVRSVVLPPDHAPRDVAGNPVASMIVNGIDPTTVESVRAIKIQTGQPLRPDDAQTVLITTLLAERTGLQVGDTITLTSAEGLTTFTVGGIALVPVVGEVDNIFITLAAAQQLFNVPGKINTIEAMFTPGVDGDAVRQAALASAGSGFQLGATQWGTELLSSMGVAETAFNVFGVMVLLMAGFIIFNTFRTLLIERRHDIGMLRAVGASRRTITGLLLAESLVQGVTGTALGLVMGYLLAEAFVIGVEPVWKEMVSIPLGRPSFTAANLVMSIGLGLGVTLISGLFPALASNRITPLEALRPAEAKLSIGGSTRRAVTGAVLVGLAVLALVSGNFNLQVLGALVFLAGLVIATPAIIHPITTTFGKLLGIIFAREGQIAQGNVIRQSGRSAVTTSTIMIGMAILVSVGGVGATMINGVTNYMDRSMGADFIIMPQTLLLGTGNVGAAPTLLEDVRAVPGIAAVTNLRYVTARVNDVDVQVVGIDPVSYAAVAGLDFSSGEPQAAFAALAEGQAIILNGVLSAQAQAKVGDSITLLTPAGEQSFTVAGIGNDLLNYKLSTAYLPNQVLSASFGESSDILLMANAAPNADMDAVDAEVKRIVSAYPAFRAYTISEWQETVNTDFLGKTRYLYALMIVFAVPSLIALVNTLGINVLERTRELGMLRALGSTRRQVQRMIIAESLLLSAIGTAFGLLAGIWLGYVMTRAMSVSGYNFPYAFPLVGILTAIAAGLIFGVLAALIPARHATRLNIVRALQYE